MFLVQSKTSDGRLFYSYITGHEARLAKNWVSIPASLPHALSFQGLPTMSFSSDAGNFTRARWTTIPSTLPWASMPTTDQTLT